MNMVFDEFQKGIEPDSNRFNRIVQEVKESLSDKSGMPVSMAMDDRNFILQPNSLSSEELLGALGRMKLEDITEGMLAKLKESSYHTDMLIMGNLPEERAT